jgi:hypothetical protein
MPYDETDDYFGEAGTFAPKTQKKEVAYPFNIDIDFKNYERTEVKKKVLAYVSKQD